jgi:ubiquinone/menaquinone biosynthesis C-methylase UbiE
MRRLSFPRRLLKLIHPEGIPWPGSVLYNALSSSGIFQKNYELIAKDIDSYCSEGTVLDVGTGPGWLLLKIHQINPKLRLTGIDISAAMIAKARNNIEASGLSKEIDFMEGNVSKLPFPDSSFDCVVSTGSIHHWKNPIDGLNEVYRVLKPSKHALIYDIVSDTPGNVMRSVSKEFGRLKMFLLWIHALEEPFYSQKEFQLLVRPSLFVDASIRFVGVLCCLTMKKG